MLRFFVKCFAVIGGLVVLSILALIGIGIWASVVGPKVPQAAILTLDINGNLPDAPKDSGLLDLLSAPKTNLRDVIGALDKAGADPRVKGMLLRIVNEPGTAQAQELRDAISAFRSKGKTVYAYADTFGEFSSGTRGYYLASACDEIWMQPLGLVGLVGLRAEQPFFRGTLEKLGLVAHFDARSQYKTAMNMLTQDKMTDAHREEVQHILDSVSGQIVAGISDGRKIAPERAQQLIAGGPFLAQQAVDNHTIDHLGYVDDALSALKNRVGTESEAMRLSKYVESVGGDHQKGPVVALINADGLMVRGKGDGNAFTGSGMMGSDAIVHAFRLAAQDKDVRAILFRIDSPGGSATAAESIWAEVMAARRAGKKVVVSMGSVAGSGGYYIAAAADKIVAEPATLTGSIGVVAGKIIVSGALDKIGSSVDAAQTSDNAAMFSATQDFDAEGYKHFEAMLDDIYAGFKSRVAQGRHMDANAVEAVAKGRVWTGEDAKKNNLVDALGGYDTAIALVKAEIGVEANQDITLKTFPPSSGGVAALVKRATGRGDDDPLVQTLMSFNALATELRLLTSAPGALVMTPMEIR